MGLPLLGEVGLGRGAGGLERLYLRLEGRDLRAGFLGGLLGPALRLAAGRGARLGQLRGELFLLGGELGARAVGGGLLRGERGAGRFRGGELRLQAGVLRLEFPQLRGGLTGGRGGGGELGGQLGPGGFRDGGGGGEGGFRLGFVGRGGGGLLAGGVEGGGGGLSLGVAGGQLLPGVSRGLARGRELRLQRDRFGRQRFLLGVSRSWGGASLGELARECRLFGGEVGDGLVGRGFFRGERRPRRLGGGPLGLELGQLRLGGGERGAGLGVGGLGEPGRLLGEQGLGAFQLLLQLGVLLPGGREFLAELAAVVLEGGQFRRAGRGGWGGGGGLRGPRYRGGWRGRSGGGDRIEAEDAGAGFGGGAARGRQGLGLGGEGGPVGVEPLPALGELGVGEAAQDGVERLAGGAVFRGEGEPGQSLGQVRGQQLSGGVGEAQVILRDGVASFGLGPE